MKLVCLDCGCEELKAQKARFEPKVKGEKVEVVVPAFVCQACGESVMDTEQMNGLRKVAADVYRIKHSLLTSVQIASYRRALGMSQAAFAKYLKVGEASIQRWEACFVQDRVQDDNIRLRCDEAYAQHNALRVHWKNHPADHYSGQRNFSWPLFKQALLYLVESAPSPIFLNKALFYADFAHYRRTGRSITGARYVPLEYGPCPDQYQGMIQLLVEEGALGSGEGHNLVAKEKPDLSVFDDAERETLQMIHNIGGKELFELSHKERAYLETPALQFISYELANSLLISK